MVTLEDVFAEATKYGTGDEVKALHAIAVKHGLHISVSVKNIIYSARPPSYATSDGSVLYSIAIKPKVEGRVHVQLRSTTFADYFPIGALEVRKMIGDDGSYNMDAKRVKIFAEEMDALFAKIHAQ
jgi:hypothetical protein